MPTLDKHTMILCIANFKTQITCFKTHVPGFTASSAVPVDIAIPFYYSEKDAEDHGWFKDVDCWFCPECAKEIKHYAK